MSYMIHGIGTATPRFGIDQNGAAVIGASICCETEQQRRMVKALYGRAGVDFRHSVLLEEVGAPCDVRTAAGHAGFAPDTMRPMPAFGGDNEDTGVAQTFFEPAAHADDCGPSTAQRIQKYEQYAPRLACDAAEAALRNSGVSASDITHLITVSCTGFAAPGVDLALIRSCGLKPTVSRTHVGFMGCHGAINGLRLAKAFAEADPAARVLLCAVELCTLHQQYGWHPDRIVSNALFADGAAAAVGWSGTPGDSPSWRVQATGSTVIGGTEDLMGWHIGDHGFEMTLSAQVPDTIRESLRPWLTKWLSEQGLAPEEIRAWAVHPGGPRILRACAEALDFTAGQLDDSLAVLATCGNMSSPTVLFILQRLMREAGNTPCVMLAFGPGLCVEAALLVQDHCRRAWA